MTRVLGSYGLDWGLREGKQPTSYFFCGPSSPGGRGVKIALPLWNRPGALEGTRPLQRLGQGHGKRSRESTREQRAPPRPLQHFAPALWPQHYLKWDKK